MTYARRPSKNRAPARLRVCQDCTRPSDAILGTWKSRDTKCDRCAARVATGYVVQTVRA